MNSWQCLVAQAQHINQMAEELEAAILELKALAKTVDSERRSQHLKGKPFQSVCKHFAVSVPYVKQNPNDSFSLTTRKIDLYQAEREAATLAQTLRQLQAQRATHKQILR